MMTLRAQVRALAVVLAAVAAMGSNCSFPLSTATSTGCKTNVECGAFKECNAGTCRCLDNRACGNGEFCNAAFQCQTVAGCQDNTDCEEQGSDLICNVKVGQCDPSSVCSSDSQCPLGKICDASGACLDACKDEADCILGAGCIRTTAGDALGRCRAGACSTTDQCQPGYNCDLSTNSCVFDTRGPFCGACQNFDPNSPECGAGQYANYCLIDTSDPTGDSHFCGVDCSQQQGCPAGYDCQQVIIVGPPATPTCGVESCNAGHCTQTGGNCTVSEDCPLGPPGGDCPRGHTGLCAGNDSQNCTTDEDCGGSPGSCRKAACGGGENSAVGFCGCVIDGDCPQDRCIAADLSDPDHPVFGHCLISGRRCLDDLTDCGAISCVNGGCLIGENCAPSGERRCQDLVRP